MCVSVEDDGCGGANASGSGLFGLARRVAALDGILGVISPPGGPTLVTADGGVWWWRGAVGGADGRGGERSAGRAAGERAVLGGGRGGVAPLALQGAVVSRSSRRRSNRLRRHRLGVRAPGRRPSRRPPPSTGASPCRRGPRGRRWERRTPPSGGSVRRCRRRSGSGTRSEAYAQVNRLPSNLVGHEPEARTSVGTSAGLSRTQPDKERARHSGRSDRPCREPRGSASCPWLSGRLPVPLGSG